jgi:hypothetical protein
MYPHSVVANDEITMRAELSFIFENNDGSGREELGQIELSDDDEAFALSRS